MLSRCDKLVEAYPMWARTAAPGWGGDDDPVSHRSSPRWTDCSCHTAWFPRPAYPAHRVFIRGGMIAAMLVPLLAGHSHTPTHVDVLPTRAGMLTAPVTDDSAWLSDARRVGGSHWVANAQVDVHSIRIGSTTVPVTRLSGPPAQSTYVASLHAAWVSYPFAEVVTRATRWRRTQTAAAFTLAAPLVGLMAASGLRRAALVGNHLLSTNLHPTWNPTDIRQATAELAERFSDRPLALRNVCPDVDPRLCEGLVASGWQLVPSRRIYLVDPRDPAVWKHNHLKRDRKLLHGDDLELAGPADIPAQELTTLRALFRQLFIDKHCALNPDFTPAFFDLCHQQRFLDLHVLRLDGRAVGVLGIHERDGWVTTPLIGYDTTLPQNLGIYRRLMALLYEEAGRRGCRLHLSSGAGGFKSGRGGEPHLEYTAVFNRHLGIAQRLAGDAFGGLLRRFAPRVLEETG